MTIKTYYYVIITYVLLHCYYIVITFSLLPIITFILLHIITSLLHHYYTHYYVIIESRKSM